MAFFEAQVLPLLQSRCYECHSHEKKIKGGLALDLKSGWQTGGDSGPAIIPGDVSKSHVITAVRYASPEMEMPPKGKLSASEIEVFEKWVAMGAPDPRVKQTTTKSARVIDIHTVKPIDREMIAKCARETKAIVVAEEHLADSGLGVRVAQAAAESNPCVMEFVGIHNTYAESGTPEGLLDKYGLIARDVIAAAKRVMARKQ